MIGQVVFLFALTLACVYSLVLVTLLLGLFKVKRNDPRQRSTGMSLESTFVYVIVAARNEEENIARCLRSLLNQTYPEELYEVILVDDNSTDNTLSIARSLSEKDERLKLLSPRTRRPVSVSGVLGFGESGFLAFSPPRGFPSSHSATREEKKPILTVVKSFLYNTSWEEPILLNS